MRLLVARHAEDMGSDYDDSDRKLTSKGRKQAEELSKVVEAFLPDIAICSAMTRARQTAKLTVPDSIDIVENELFNEQMAGNEERDRTSTGYVKMNERLSGGESYAELYERVKAAWDWFLSSYCDLNKVVIICHGRFITFLVSHILGQNPNGFNLAIANTSYLIFEISDQWRPQLVLPEPSRLYI